MRDGKDHNLWVGEVSEPVGFASSKKAMGAWIEKWSATRAVAAGLNTAGAVEFLVQRTDSLQRDWRTSRNRGSHGEHFSAW
jgi:hypothetical protein